MVTIGKQLSHIIRLYQFITNLLSGKTYKESLTYFEPKVKSKIMFAKLSKYHLEEAKELALQYTIKIHNLKEHYMNTEELNIDYEVENILNNVKYNILEQYLKDKLLPKEMKPYKLCPDYYNSVWVTSDNHFGHNNILEYENRLEKLNVNNIEEHDNELIRRWNSIVNKKDLVLILGDFSFKKTEDTNELLKQLNGDKVLIRGNHDLFIDDKKFDKSLIKAIYDYKEIKYKGYEIALMHYPILSFKHQSRETKPAIHLFGHIHSSNIEVPKHSYNVGVDVNDYYPVDLIVAIAKALDNGGCIYE